jgi:hypothetical protein
MFNWYRPSSGQGPANAGRHHHALIDRIGRHMITCSARGRATLNQQQIGGCCYQASITSIPARSTGTVEEIPKIPDHNRLYVPEPREHVCIKVLVEVVISE